MNDISSGAFSQVPANTRVAGFYPEVDDSLARTFQANKVAVIIAQRLSTGTIAAGVPTTIFGAGGQEDEYYGSGSHAAEMVKAFRDGNKTSTLKIIALDDNPSGAAATKDVTITGPSTENGTLNFYVGDRRVQAGVVSGDDETAMATAIKDAITAHIPSLPVTASNEAGVLTVTHKHKGEIGNDVRLQMNVLSLLGGEKTPAGVTVSIPDDGYLAGGTGNPDQTPAIAAMGDTEYDFIGMPYTDTASLDAWNTELLSRWDPIRKIYGQVYTAKSGTPAELVTFGTARNDKLISCMGTYDHPGPAYKTCARYLAQASRALANHGARPLHTLELVGEMVAPAESQLTFADQNTLLFSGIATCMVVAGGRITIGRAISLYQENDFGSPDTAWLDMTTSATLTEVLRRRRHRVESTYLQTRCILVDNGTPVKPGLPFATPNKIHATLVALEEEMQRDGLVERSDRFADTLIVARDDGEPTRVNWRAQDDLANPLIVLAELAQFSLQWPAELSR